MPPVVSSLPGIVHPIESAAREDPHAKSKTKAEILREYRAKMGKFHLPEHLLLRDALYLLQGISGKYVRFSDLEGGTGDSDHRVVFVDDRDFIVPPPTQALVHKLSELGYLYSCVATFVNERGGEPSIGMIEQSLCHFLQGQLTEYYRMVAVLESQMSSKPDGDPAVREDSGLTLRRLDVWIDEWRLRMRMMSACVENCKGTKGGALVSLIHANTNNGDPFVRSFTDQLLEEVSKPFFLTLQRWLFTGDLHDPYEEFFVAANPDLVDVQYIHPATNLSGDGGFGGGGGTETIVEREEGEVGGFKLWESKYTFRRGMLPSFVSEEFGRKIFSTGKSLNFIRYSCHDSDWVATRSKLTKAALKYSDIAGLERSIDDAYRVASQRLFDIFFDKFKLMNHLTALKSYLMLGHGDFADRLMDSLGPSLIRPANTLYRHNLTTTLETAIRYSNAQNDSPDVLRRLDARMLDYQHGEIGWDVFTLEYKVDAPIDTVLGPDSMIQYQRLFNHLWKMKRVEGVLTSGWMRISSGAKTFLRVPEYEHEWHQVRVVMAEMIHFLRQMQAFSQLEVIACHWEILVEFLAKKEGDLDALIEAHRTYLDLIVKKVLLLHPRSGKEENILTQVREAFNIILQFREATDNFYNHTLAESARRDRERDIERGVITGVTEASQRHDSTEVLSRILRRIKEYAIAFSDRTFAIVAALSSHPEQDCRFLAIRLSFNDFYKPKKDPART